MSKRRTALSVGVGVPPLEIKISAGNTVADWAYPRVPEKPDGQRVGDTDRGYLRPASPDRQDPRMKR